MTLEEVKEKYPIGTIVCYDKCEYTIIDTYQHDLCGGLIIKICDKIGEIYYYNDDDVSMLEIISLPLVVDIIAPKNNDGRESCYWCKNKTKQVNTGFSYYNICSTCGR